MAVAVHITPHHMTRQDYEQMIGELEASGAGEPEGRVFHAAYGDEQVQMFEVWESEDQFKAHREQVFALIQGAGFDAGMVQVHALHERPD